jgi:hypothetical protein
MNLSSRSKSLGHEWIFKIKMKVGGIIYKYKARRVVKEIRQQEGMDYLTFICVKTNCRMNINSHCSY